MYPPPPPPPNDPYLDYINSKIPNAQVITTPVFNPVIPVASVLQPIPLPSAANPVVASAPPAKKRINVRQKGQRGEREIVDLLQGLVNPIRAKYRLEPITLQRNALQAHLGGADLHGLDGFSVEVKFQENTCVPAWWRQCLAQAEKSRGVPILFYRASRQPWLVVMRGFLNTPGDRDQVEIDMTISLDDFTTWFNEAYDEACVDELQRMV